MKVKKTDGYDSYKADLSYLELMAIKAACQNAGDPVADEIAKSLEWHFAHETPPPGLDEHPAKSAEEANPEADALLAAPVGDAEILPQGDGSPDEVGDGLPPSEQVPEVP